MCVFMNTLPSHSKTAESAKKKNLAIFIRPTAAGEYYQFRLLAFKSPNKNGRDYPFIERYVHTHWGVNPDTGKKCIDGQVVCPVTKFAQTEGNPYDECPICKFANMNFLANKESGFKDRDAAKKNRDFSRKFEAIIPVYVKNDPTYPANNGKLRVIIFSDKKFYKEFQNEIQRVSRETCCFNGTKGVNFYIHMTQVPKIVNEGKPNQYTFNENVIDKWGFTKTDKAHEIPAITKEAIDAFEFDETYYVTSTKEEIQEFYNKFIKVSNDDIPEEDVPVYEAPKPVAKAPVKLQNESAPKVETKELIDDDLGDLIGNDDSIPEPAPQMNLAPELMEDDEDLLDGIEIDDN